MKDEGGQVLFGTITYRGRGGASAQAVLVFEGDGSIVRLVERHQVGLE